MRWVLRYKESGKPEALLVIMGYHDPRVGSDVRRSLFFMATAALSFKRMMDKVKRLYECVDDAARNVPILHPAPRVHSAHSSHFRDRCIGSRSELVKTYVFIHPHNHSHMAAHSPNTINMVAERPFRSTLDVAVEALLLRRLVVEAVANAQSISDVMTSRRSTCLFIGI